MPIKGSMNMGCVCTPQALPASKGRHNCSEAAGPHLRKGTLTKDEALTSHPRLLV